MNVDFDYELDSTQWEALKALGGPVPDDRRVNPSTARQLVAWELATLEHGRLAITPKGRRVVLRGSPRLWDVAA